jgi:hypothetical protein
MEKHLHIISYTVPYPPDQGGLYDVFYKLKALHAQGVHIHLHCFDYGRGEQPDLNQYCDSVHYYQRFTGHKGISASLPYIVASRKNEALLQNLLNDNYPIMMEGVHCTYPLMDDRFKNRDCFVRLHNVEYRYYNDLCQQANAAFRKIYYKRESIMLKAYERKIASKAIFWGMTEADNDVYRHEFGTNNIEQLSLYIPDNWVVEEKHGYGNFCLYHGDLSVDANEKAATWLLEKVFSKINIPFVIAGHHPSKKLEELAHSMGHTCLVADPSEREMQDMIAKAQINILPSYTNTGIKIKLVNAIFNGRHCVVNDATVNHSGLESTCHIANSAIDFIEKVSTLFSQPFTKEESEKRRLITSDLFSNERNAKKQVGWIWRVCKI